MTGVVLTAGLLTAVIASSGSTARGDVGVGLTRTGGESIDTLVVTDNLYLYGPGGAMFAIGVGKDASGKPVVVATPAG